MKNNSTIILTGSEVAELLPLNECILAVENAFKLLAEGKVKPPSILGVHVQDGGYHIKAGVMGLDKSYFVAKTNANFPKNQKDYGLPTIQGVVTVYDTSNGRLLALMDSIEVTIIRTGAASAVAAKYLAKKDAKTATIIGCGSQGKISLKMLLEVRPLETVYVYDLDPEIAVIFATELRDLDVDIIVVDDFKKAVAKSDICVTCTTSKKALLKKEDVNPGTLIVAVGSDNEEKQELEPELLASSKVVADIINQCAEIGELHHALEAKVMTKEDVYGEIGEIILGNKQGRQSEDEIIIFDSTGTGLQDVASASIVYEKAIDRKMGLVVSFAD
jgi:alanine dehydrogenase